MIQNQKELAMVKIYQLDAVVGFPATVPVRIGDQWFCYFQVITLEGTKMTYRERIQILVSELDNLVLWKVLHHA